MIQSFEARPLPGCGMRVHHSSRHVPLARLRAVSTHSSTSEPAPVGSALRSWSHSDSISARNCEPVPTGWPASSWRAPADAEVSRMNDAVEGAA